jgi:hypothetical protein
MGTGLCRILPSPKKRDGYSIIVKKITDFNMMNVRFEGFHENSPEVTELPGVSWVAMKDVFQLTIEQMHIQSTNL